MGTLQKKCKVKLMVELLIGLTASLDEYTDSSFCVHTQGMNRTFKILGHVIR